MDKAKITIYSLPRESFAWLEKSLRTTNPKIPSRYRANLSRG